MNCPKCNSLNIKVMETINGLNNEIHRRKKCIDCSLVFRSIEVIDLSGKVFEKEYRSALKNKNRSIKRKIGNG